MRRGKLLKIVKNLPYTMYVWIMESSSNYWNSTQITQKLVIFYWNAGKKVGGYVCVTL